LKSEATSAASLFFVLPTTQHLLIQSFSLKTKSLHPGLDELRESIAHHTRNLHIPATCTGNSRIVPVNY